MDDDKDRSGLLEMMDREERGYFRRLHDMCTGLTKPRESLDFKEAMQELHRQWAPLAGLFVPLFLIVLMGIIKTDVRPPAETAQAVEVIEEIEPTEPLEEPEPPPPEEEIEPPEEIIDDVVSEIQSPPLGEIVPNEAVTPNPPVKIVSSPVVMKGISTRGSGGGGLGGGTRLAGDMVGMFLDLSRDGKGVPRKLVNMASKNDLLHHDMALLLREKLSKNALKNFNVVPKRVYMSHLILPFVSSSVGPKTYKVEKTVKPNSPWIAIYKGFLDPEESGTYRVAGIYDDILVVQVDNRSVLEFTWDDRMNKVGQPSKTLGTGWAQKDAAVAGKHKMRGFQNTPLFYGDWFELKAGRKTPVTIMIGDNGGQGAGGLTGGILLVEQKGKTYEKTPDGLPLLPPFATTRLTFAEREALRKTCDPSNTKTSGHYAYSVKNIPTLHVTGKRYTAAFDDNEVEVDVGDL